jgi:hypothetical protein
MSPIEPDFPPIQQGQQIRFIMPRRRFRGSRHRPGVAEFHRQPKMKMPRDIESECWLIGAGFQQTDAKNAETSATFSS